MDDSLQLIEQELAFLKEMRNDLVFPPPCFVEMQAKFLHYESRTMLKVSFPVTNNIVNPIGTMQGGYISAAFDNVFGPLSYLTAHSTCATIDLQTHFLRGIKSGDTLIITAKVISRGSQLIHMSGEAMNVNGKLIATATSNVMIFKL